MKVSVFIILLTLTFISCNDTNDSSSLFISCKNGNYKIVSQFRYFVDSIVEYREYQTSGRFSQKIEFKFIKNNNGYKYERKYKGIDNQTLRFLFPFFYKKDTSYVSDIKDHLLAPTIPYGSNNFSVTIKKNGDVYILRKSFLRKNIPDSIYYDEYHYDENFRIKQLIVSTINGVCVLK